MIKKVIEIGVLFDFYGKLLSDRQYKLIKLFYIEDLSLTEIGNNLGITKQAVSETLKRAENNLYEYEETLGLVLKFKTMSVQINEILKIIDYMKNNLDNKNEIINCIDKIENKSIDIFEDNWEV